MLELPGEPGIALYFLINTTKRDTYGKESHLGDRDLARGALAAWAGTSSCSACERRRLICSTSSAQARAGFASDVLGAMKWVYLWVGFKDS